MWQFTMSFPVSGLYGPVFEKKLKLRGVIPGLACFTGIAALHIAVFSAAPFFMRDRPPAPAATELLLTLQAASAAGAAETVETPPAPPALPRKTVETADALSAAPPLEEAAPVTEAETPQSVEDAGTAEEASVTAAGGIPVTGGSPEGEGSAPAARDAAITDAEYLALVMALLEKNKIYPLSARKRGIEGDIRAEFTIRRDGSVSGMRLADASGHRFLAQAAFETIRSAAPFPVMEGRGGDYKVEVTIRYQLEG